MELVLSYTLRRQVKKSSFQVTRNARKNKTNIKPKRKQHVNMWKLKSLMQSDANTRTFFLNTAWGESQLFQAGLRIHSDDQRHTILAQISVADIIRPSSVCLPAWHIAKENIQLFHMQASIRSIARENIQLFPHARIHPPWVAHVNTKPIPLQKHRALQARDPQASWKQPMVPLLNGQPLSQERLPVAATGAGGAASCVTSIQWF